MYEDYEEAKKEKVLRMAIPRRDPPFHVRLNNVGPHRQPSQTLCNLQCRHLWQTS